jgi:Ion channel
VPTEVYDNWTVNALVVLASVLTVTAVVLIHYEGLVALSRRLVRMHTLRRRKVLYGVYGLLALHAIEIVMFGTVMWCLLQWPQFGTMAGSANLHLFDAIYLSAATFTTVGFGDIAPHGPIRFLSGVEALTGFVLITWSASFTYIEMEHFWRVRDDPR